MSRDNSKLKRRTLVPRDEELNQETPPTEAKDSELQTSAKPKPIAQQEDADYADKP